MEIGKTFCGRTDGRTDYVRKDGRTHLSSNLLGHRRGDDLKIVSKVASEDQIKILQSDLHKMFNWLQDWQMLFNTDKSKVIHFGYNNKEVDYILGNQRIRDLMQLKRREI